jgi:hypothetical protein
MLIDLVHIHNICQKFGLWHGKHDFQKRNLDFSYQTTQRLKLTTLEHPVTAKADTLLSNVYTHKFSLPCLLCRLLYDILFYFLGVLGQIPRLLNCYCK